MKTRQLSALSWPLAHQRWQALHCSGGRWQLIPRGGDEALEVQADLVLDLQDGLWLRLRSQVGGWRRLWPPQWHFWLRRADHPGQWTLLRASLAAARRRHWLGAP